ncbi:MAG TPA: heme ABC exporter ATP-binding protein CcmA [Methylomirabilota bacterium]|nr:heme ABC exporter ATP-binding protein CcmA [Methylomirabilota bacterium]
MSGAAQELWQDEAHLAARGLACRRGERLVFSGLDFDLHAGELLVLRGPNGSGKSSLLRLVAGLVPRERGTFTWNGMPLADAEGWHVRIAYLGHADAAKPELTPREDLRFWLALRGTRGDVDLALERLGLTALADLPCRMLSAGQRRRLALARVVASGARLWLLDEPFNALDEAASIALRALLSEHRARGGMVLLAAHGAVQGAGPTSEMELGRAGPAEGP